MNTKTVRLTTRQLKRLVNEALESRPGLGPCPEAEDVANAAFHSALKYFGSFYDPDDPSMEAAGGQQAWRKQAHAAADELEPRVLELVKEIEEKLIDGQYWRRR